jgi:hypothetical protein
MGKVKEMHQRNRIFEAILDVTRENQVLLREILHRLPKNHYTVRVTQENTMSIGNIQAGTSGTFSAVLDDNGSPITLPSGSTFTWTADDTTVTITPSEDTTSAVIEVPAGDTGTSVTVTATVTVNGQTVSGSLSVALTAIPQTFTVVVTQTA